MTMKQRRTSEQSVDDVMMKRRGSNLSIRSNGLKRNFKKLSSFTLPPESTVTLLLHGAASAQAVARSNAKNGNQRPVIPAVFSDDALPIHFEARKQRKRSKPRQQSGPAAEAMGVVRLHRSDSFDSLDLNRRRMSLSHNESSLDNSNSNTSTAWEEIEDDFEIEAVFDVDFIW